MELPAGFNGRLKEIKKSDGVIANVMTIPAGYTIGKHTHPYNHLSVLLDGEVEVTVIGDEPTIYKNNEIIEIEKYRAHTIRAITDAKWMCIHSSTAVHDADQINIFKED